MGTKRVGLARTQALIQNLKRELELNGTTFNGQNAKIITAAAAKTLTAAESGATVIWTHDAGTGYNITLPKCAQGLKFTIKFELGTAIAAHHITVGDAADRFFGVAKVWSTTADNTAAQSKALLATGAKYLHCQSDVATTGGNAGDIIELVAIDDTHWLVSANLHTTNANPGSIAVFKDAP
jgi:hypothetical protein